MSVNVDWGVSVGWSSLAFVRARHTSEDETAMKRKVKRKVKRKESEDEMKMQIGVFLSRSSLAIVRVRRVWLITAFQVLISSDYHLYTHHCEGATRVARHRLSGVWLL